MLIEVRTNATFVELDGIKYYIGDEVKSGLDLDTDEEHIFEEGIVAFGEFGAEVSQCYGFYVANPKTGEQVSEAGLTKEHIKVIKQRDNGKV